MTLSFCLPENDIPQTLLLEDEQKRILDSSPNTDLSPLSLFKVSTFCQFFPL